LSLCLTKHHAMKTYCGSGGIAPRILDLGTRWRWVVIFIPRPLYPQGNSPWYPLDRRLGGPQSRSGRGGEEKNFQLLLYVYNKCAFFEKSLYFWLTLVKTQPEDDKFVSKC
jgi:hypothetical protein